MMLEISVIERAFELARDGPYSTIKDIRAQLKREGFNNVDAHVDGTLAKQLRQLCKKRLDSAGEVGSAV